MNTFRPDPWTFVKGGFLAVVALLMTAAAVGAQPFTSSPGGPAETGVSAELWAQIDAGSLATIHRGQPTESNVSAELAAQIDAGSLATIERGQPADQVLAVVYTTTGSGIEWSYGIGDVIEGWFHAVAEAGAIGGIPS